MKKLEGLFISILALILLWGASFYGRIFPKSYTEFVEELEEKENI
jgi:hypothetical protein